MGLTSSHGGSRSPDKRGQDQRRRGPPGISRLCRCGHFIRATSRVEIRWAVGPSPFKTLKDFMSYMSRASGDYAASADIRSAPVMLSAVRRV